jgi:hypothetical protein
MYGHHGSKAAANMVGHLLGYDLKKKGIPIVMVHVGSSSSSSADAHKGRADGSPGS